MFEVRFNVLVETPNGDERWVTVVVLADYSMTQAEIQEEAERTAHDVVEAESGTGGSPRHDYDGPRVVQVGGIVPV